MRIRNLGRAGFTLVEVMIALAIVGLVMGIVVNRVNRSVGRNMKSAGNKLATVVRYLYNRSAIEGLYIKLVIDVGGQTYWVQSSADPVVVSREDEYDAAADAKKREAKDKDIATAFTGKKDESKEGETEEKDEAEKKLLPPKENFSQDETHLLKVTKLPDVVFFKDVWVEHMKNPVDSGEAAIYFFPTGYVEHAIINLRDKDDETFYSIETEPLSGNVISAKEYRRMEAKGK